MTLQDFTDSLENESPPAGLSPALTALWIDGRGDWDKAHRTVQNETSREASWVHAYLHRKEGDDANAGYWYSRAAKGPFFGSLDDEWREIVTDLLNR